MALGGGKWLTQNKVLPGAYINFVSGKRASISLSDRGVATIPIELNWGPDGEIFKVESGDFLTDTLNIFGYSYTDDEMVLLREIFKKATVVYFYRLNSGEKAENQIATAKHSGTRGNDIRIVISKDVDNEDIFIVETLIDDIVTDIQEVKELSELKDNSFVEWKKEGVLEETAGLPLENGTNAEEVTGEDYQNYLDKVDGYGFNVMGCPTDDEKIIDLFVQFTKRMRDEVGALFQTLIYDRGDKYDHEGIIPLVNKVMDEGLPEYAGVYYYTGAQAGVAVNESLDNKTYEGELTFFTDYKQSELEEFIENGKFVLHNQNGEVRVLVDINSFVSHTNLKHEAFSNNQTIRVLDEKGNMTALIFNNRYNGHIPNDKAGRESFWDDMVDVNMELQQIRAIQEYDESNLTIEQGKEAGDVVMIDVIKPVNAMRRLYSTIYVV